MGKLKSVRTTPYTLALVTISEVQRDGETVTVVPVAVGTFDADGNFRKGSGLTGWGVGLSFDPAGSVWTSRRAIDHGMASATSSMGYATGRLSTGLSVPKSALYFGVDDAINYATVGDEVTPEDKARLLALIYAKQQQ